MENAHDNKLNAWHPSSEPRETSSHFWHHVREWIKVIIVALIISLPIRFFIAEPFVVEGASMDPTFESGQFLIVDRISYNTGTPSRGDVTIFKYPNNPRVYYIKRVIGLPGETVRISDGIVSIVNTEYPEGFILDESYIGATHRSHETATVTLGPTEYFVMGDNRSQSSDSRSWGPLDEKFIIGRPVVRLLPLTAVSLFPGEHHE
ncbi:MAG: signal peptidase I [Patescibacteria group bacterium]